MTFYVENDGSITNSGNIKSAFTHKWMGYQPSRHFATMHGASLHPLANPVTAITIQPPEAHYDAAEVMANGWSCKGLEPVGYHTIIRIGAEA